MGRASCAAVHGVVEDAVHFLVHCPCLARHRAHFRRRLGLAMTQVGAPGRAYLNHYDSAASDYVLALLTGRLLVIPCPAGMNPEMHTMRCAKAAFLFDKVCKNFFVRCWRARQNLIGKISVRNGALEHEKPAIRVLLAPEPKPFVFHSHLSWQWKDWIPSDPLCSAREQDPPKAFVVLCGRQVGFFYTWFDAKASVSGFPNTKFKGFDTESRAT